MNGKPILTISQRALQEIKKRTVHKTPHIRINLRKRGCSGLSYTMNYASHVDPYDEIVVQDGVYLILAPHVLMRVIGTQIDYVTHRIRSEFVFDNPNVQGRCGCGESFAIPLK